MVSKAMMDGEEILKGVLEGLKRELYEDKYLTII